MADVLQDLYGLQYSPSFTIEGQQEADINLSLPPAPSVLASVHGTVTNGVTPIADATVKLFDSAGVPYRHTLTDASGAYVIDGVPAGTYSLAAVADGYRVSDAVGVTLTGGATAEIPIVCALDATLALGSIAGVLSVAGSAVFTPLAGAKITLKSNLGGDVAVTYTVDDGEFVFYDVADGVYTLIASADGYLATAPMTVTISGGSIANVTMSMAVDERTYSGTVSGVIRNQSGAAVAGCFVGLYQLNAGAGSETLVATTKTNSLGKYLFGGVGSGQYLVKAKLNG